MTKTMWNAVGLAAVFVAGFAARGVMPGDSTAYAQAAPRVFELRTYTPAEGKLDLLHARFRNHTLRIFQRHGMTNVWYGKPMDAPLSQTTLIYMLAHQSREAAKKSWDAFRADPEWTRVAKESGVGPVKVESVFLEPTDYSPMK
ncbi:MAG: NIPSNAP family protein [Acidobacteria bacterium]|nr:NIPSNAP family protein [Acidobacteriota bacterium]